MINIMEALIQRLSTIKEDPKLYSGLEFGEWCGDFWCGSPYPFTAVELLPDTNTGYPLTVRTVTAKPNLNMVYNKSKLPMIEVLRGDMRFPSGVKFGGTIEAKCDFIFRIVAPKEFDDADMSTFVSCVFRCLYSNSYTKTNNSGSGLEYQGKNLVQKITPVDIVSDFNLIETNRVWELLFTLDYNVMSYNF